MATVTDSLDIAATPDAVFAAISQLDQMGRFSPENTGGTWQRGATGPSTGAKFKGTNANGSDSWTTTVTVVACVVPRSFVFDVTFGPFKVSRWSFTIEATDTGSTVTESWRDQRSSFVKRFSKGAVSDRESFTRESIRTTLARLKEYLEAPNS